ncbi:hypothetical protein ACFPJ1_20835 [Kribbella qitaiheensis]|uniref:hypothetical protein n=1 Tax=Kribbella qitaiheensis TaxID=1544730 RepID=UPI00360601B0
MRSARFVATAFGALLVLSSGPNLLRPDGHPPGPATVVPLATPLADVLLIGGTVAPGPDGKPALWNVSTGKPAYLNAVNPVTGASLVSAPLPKVRAI